MYNFRTDLADERRDIFRKANKLEDEIPGVETEETTNGDNIKSTKVKVISEEGEKALGKPKGTYVTIDIKNLKIAAEEEIQKAADTLCLELKNLLNIHVGTTDDVLVVGLGNAYVTPDALGPKVISYIDVTRHWFEYLPQFVNEKTRPVSAISPGVLGTTGIETVEILKGIVSNVKPKLIIVIDALASRSIERISSTIQLADTGIVPGSGVGNTRKELTQDTLGVPVIAIGIPTVVEAATIAADTLDIFAEKMKHEIEKSSNQNANLLERSIENLMSDDKYDLIKDVLITENYNLIVTPKEIDELIENMSSVVARGINYSLQE